MIRFATLALLAAPLALAACDSASDGGVGGSGETFDPVAAPEGASWVDTATATPEGGFLIGNPDAPVKVVEFASHTCGGCASFAETGAAALKADYIPTGTVSYEIRNLIRDPIDLTIATLARCGDPAAFHPLSDQAWAQLNTINQTINQNGAAAQAALEGPPELRFVGIAQAAGLIDFFAARGVSRNQAQACLTDTAKIEAVVETSQEQVERFNVQSTPTFLINGENVGPQSWETLETMIQEAGGAKAGAQ